MSLGNSVTIPGRAPKPSVKLQQGIKILECNVNDWNFEPCIQFVYWLMLKHKFAF